VWPGYPGHTGIEKWMVKVIRRLLYEYNYDKNQSVVNMDCLKCFYFEKCVDTLYDKIPIGIKFVQNCKNYLFEHDIIKNRIIKGGIYYDEFGNLLFNNDFRIDLNKIKRFYIVSLDNRYQFKGWHGHKKEEKYCLCLSGMVKTGMVKIDNFDNPSRDLVSEWYILKENDCEILHIPGGYANGLMKIDKNNNQSKVLFFSNMSISESANDDFRYGVDIWR